MTKKPAAFRLDADDLTVAPPVASDIPARRADPAQAQPPEQDQPRTNRWATAFWTGLGALLSLAFGLAVTRMIEDLFARAQWLGWVGVAAAGLFGLALAVLTIREVIAIRRLARFDAIRAEAEKALAARDSQRCERLAADLLARLADHPRTAAGRAAYLAATKDTIVDGPERLRLIEREVLEPLDRDATRLVAEAARRVSVVTAVSPKAAVDLAVVAITAVRLVRALAELYGGRPGTFGLLRLTRQVFVHLALTGGMAAGDTILDQLIGHGLAAKLSAKLGEGVLNGLLTARLGVAAITATRPLPYIGAPRPDVRDLAGDALGLS